MIFTLLFTLSLAVSTNDIQMTRKCIVDCARSQLGKPYVSGAAGPDNYDAVGLITYCYAQCSVPFSGTPTVSSLQGEGMSVTSSELTIADLVFPSDSHVQMYSGSGRVIHIKEGIAVTEEALGTVTKCQRIVYGDGTSSGGGDTPVAPNAGQCTVVVSELNVRASPSTSSEVVATYGYGDVIVYDSIVDGDGRKWISYIGGSGNRRYVCGKDSNGSCYVSPCPA